MCVIYRIQKTFSAKFIGVGEFMNEWFSFSKGIPIFRIFNEIWDLKEILFFNNGIHLFLNIKHQLKNLKVDS